MAEPGGPKPVSRAVQLTGRFSCLASSASSGTNSPGPGVTCITPRPASPNADASRNTSSVLASRLGTGRPPSPWCVGERDVAKPIAPAATPSATRSRMRSTSASVASRSTASSPST